VVRYLTSIAFPRKNKEVDGDSDQSLFFQIGKNHKNDFNEESTSKFGDTMANNEGKFTENKIDDAFHLEDFVAPTEETQVVFDNFNIDKSADISEIENMSDEELYRIVTKHINDNRSLKRVDVFGDEVGKDTGDDDIEIETDGIEEMDRSALIPDDVDDDDPIVYEERITDIKEEVLVEEFFAIESEIKKEVKEEEFIPKDVVFPTFARKHDGATSETSATEIKEENIVKPIVEEKKPLTPEEALEIAKTRQEFVNNTCEFNDKFFVFKYGESEETDNTNLLFVNRNSHRVMNLGGVEDSQDFYDTLMNLETFTFEVNIEEPVIEESTIETVSEITATDSNVENSSSDDEIEDVIVLASGFKDEESDEIPMDEVIFVEPVNENVVETQLNTFSTFDDENRWLERKHAENIPSGKVVAEEEFESFLHGFGDEEELTAESFAKAFEESEAEVDEETSLDAEFVAEELTDIELVDVDNEDSVIEFVPEIHANVVEVFSETAEPQVYLYEDADTSVAPAVIEEIITVAAEELNSIKLNNPVEEVKPATSAIPVVPNIPKPRVGIPVARKSPVTLPPVQPVAQPTSGIPVKPVENALSHVSTVPIPAPSPTTPVPAVVKSAESETKSTTESAGSTVTDFMTEIQVNEIILNTAGSDKADMQFYAIDDEEENFVHESIAKKAALENTSLVAINISDPMLEGGIEIMDAPDLSNLDTLEKIKAERTNYDNRALQFFNAIQDYARTNFSDEIEVRDTFYDERDTYVEPIPDEEKYGQVVFEVDPDAEKIEKLVDVYGDKSHISEEYAASNMMLLIMFLGAVFTFSLILVMVMVNLPIALVSLAAYIFVAIKLAPKWTSTAKYRCFVVDKFIKAPDGKDEGHSGTKYFIKTDCLQEFEITAEQYNVVSEIEFYEIAITIFNLSNVIQKRRVGEAKINVLPLNAATVSNINYLQNYKTSLVDSIKKSQMGLNIYHAVNEKEIYQVMDKMKFKIEKWLELNESTETYNRTKLSGF